MCADEKVQVHQVVGELQRWLEQDTTRLQEVLKNKINKKTYCAGYHPSHSLQELLRTVVKDNCLFSSSTLISVFFLRCGLHSPTCVVYNVQCGDFLP